MLASDTHQGASATAACGSSVSWASLPPPTPSQPSRWSQSSCLRLSVKSKPPSVTYFTRSVMYTAVYFPFCSRGVRSVVLFATSRVRLFSFHLSDASSPSLTQTLDLSSGPLCVPRLLNRSRGHRAAENGTPKRFLRKTRLTRYIDGRSWVSKANICPSWGSVSSLFSTVSLERTDTFFPFL